MKPGEPGCTVGVVQDGALNHAQAFGLADLDRDKPLDTHSIFNLASVSKQFTAFALLLLEQQGKLKLDDPVAKYLPELAASSQGVTLRHLVHHTGGLRDYIELLTMKGRGDADGATIHEAVLALARQTEPNEAPGVEYEYSNTGYFLLGVVIARVSGQSLAEFSEQQIFRPLGMNNTRIVDRYPDGIAAWRAATRSQARVSRSTRPAGNRWAMTRCTATCTTLRSGTRISTRRNSAAARSSTGCTTWACSTPASRRTMRRGSASMRNVALGDARGLLGRLPVEHLADPERAFVGHRAL